VTGIKKFGSRGVEKHPGGNALSDVVVTRDGSVKPELDAGKLARPVPLRRKGRYFLIHAII